MPPTPGHDPEPHRGIRVSEELREQTHSRSRSTTSSGWKQTRLHQAPHSLQRNLVYFRDRHTGRRSRPGGRAALSRPPMIERAIGAGSRSGSPGGDPRTSRHRCRGTSRVPFRNVRRGMRGLRGRRNAGYLGINPDSMHLSRSPASEWQRQTGDAELHDGPWRRTAISVTPCGHGEPRPLPMGPAPVVDRPPRGGARFRVRLAGHPARPGDRRRLGARRQTGRLRLPVLRDRVLPVGVGAAALAVVRPVRRSSPRTSSRG